MKATIFDPTNPEDHSKFFGAIPVTELTHNQDGTVEVPEDKAPQPIPGAIMFRHKDDGTIIAMSFHCPGCGSICGVNFDKAQGEPVWELYLQHPEGNVATNLKDVIVTVTPSIWHKDEPCGWHGYLTAGVWHQV